MEHSVFNLRVQNKSPSSPFPLYFIPSFVGNVLFTDKTIIRTTSEFNFGISMKKNEGFLNVIFGLLSFCFSYFAKLEPCEGVEKD